MTQATETRELIMTLLQRRTVDVWVEREPDEGAPHWEELDFWRGSITAPLDEQDASDDGVVVSLPPVEIPDGHGGLTMTDADERWAPWSRIYRVAVAGTSIHFVFLESAPSRQLGRIFALPSSPALAAVIEASTRSYLGSHAPELDSALAALHDADRARVADVGLAVLREGDALLRGLTLVTGLVGEPAHALALGDTLLAAESTWPDWRSKYGLEALRLLGTRDAHMQVQRVSMESENPQTISDAHATLRHIAGDLKAPLWEVLDELVPACGLDTEGSVALDYGPRHFELLLDDELRPLLLEQPGNRRHRDLPDPDSADETDRAAHARRHWDVVREQLSEAVPVQVHRFEQALAQQTRWDGTHWDKFVRRHPLLLHLVPRAIWGTYSPGGRRLLDTFRVTRDRTLWGPDDEPYSLELERTLGLVHLCELPDDTRDAWGVVLADYEVVTMFPQIDRPVYRPSDEARKDTNVTLNIGVPGRWALAHLHRRGWHEYDGWGHHLQKIFRSRDVKAMLSFQEHPNEIVFTTLHFERYLGYPQTHFQLRDVPEIPYSETLYEFEQLRMPQETGGWPVVPG